MVVDFQKFNYSFQSTFMPHAVSILHSKHFWSSCVLDVPYIMCKKSQIELTNIQTNYAIYF